MHMMWHGYVEINRVKLLIITCDARLVVMKGHYYNGIDILQVHTKGYG